MHNSENATGEGDCYPAVDSDEKCVSPSSLVFTARLLVMFKAMGAMGWVQACCTRGPGLLLSKYSNVYS